MNKKILTTSIVILFVSVAFAPCIHANIQQETLDSELVEITTEVCGLPGVNPQTVKLSHEDAQAVDKLFEEIKLKLDTVESREEAVEIFNEAVVELDKYGLLGGLSVKQAQKLVTGRYHNPRIVNVLEKLNHKPLDVNENKFCLISGRTDETYYEGPAKIMLDFLAILTSILIDILIYLSLDIWVLVAAIAFSVFLPAYFLLPQFQKNMPVCIGYKIGLGGTWIDYHGNQYPYYSAGWVFTIGLNGIKHWIGDRLRGDLPFEHIFIGYVYSSSPGVAGFTGIKIRGPSKDSYLGFARWVKIRPDPT